MNSPGDHLPRGDRTDAWHPYFFSREDKIAFKSRYKRPPRVRANFLIRVPEVRVIDDEGEQLGVMNTDDARRLAIEKGLDLVEVSPTARPPVCRIMDFGKFKYEESKKKRESKKKQQSVQLKEVKFRPKTEEHDYQFKKRHAEEFLKKNHKLKITIMFRGREMDHRDRGFRIMERIEQDLAHVGAVERPPKFEGRFMVMFLTPGAAKSPAKGGKPKASVARKTGGDGDAVRVAPAPVEAATDVVDKTPNAGAAEPAASDGEEKKNAETENQ